VIELFPWGFHTQRAFGNFSLVPLKIICSSWHLLLPAAAGSGAIRVLWACDVGREDLFLAAAGVMLAASFEVIAGGNRYRLPLLPVTAICAAAWWIRPADSRLEAV
jgi:hypothetical protein